MRGGFSALVVSRPDQTTENQTQIERTDVNQLPFENILMTPEMSSPHRPGFVTVRKAPLDQFASFPQQALAVVA